MKNYLIVIAVGTVIVLCVNVLRMRSGAKKITPDEVKAKIDAKENFVLLDVRTPDEYAEGRIPGAENFPDYEIKANAENRLHSKDAFIVVYCRSGIRSAGAARTLISLGYTNVHDLGGIIKWHYDLEK